MARKKLQTTEYAVTGIGYLVEGDLAVIAELARRAGILRSDIWNKYGGLQAWGAKPNQLIKEFKTTNPPEKYKLDYEQWEKAFQRCIDEIQTYVSAVKHWVIRKIYRHFKEKNGFRLELIKSLNTREWQQYPLISRWVRQYYRRGHTYKRNQINVTSRLKSPIVKRVSRNVVEVTINGNKIEKNRYQKVKLKFKVGRITPTGNLKILIRETTQVELHYCRIVQKVPNMQTSEVGVDKGFTEALIDSNGVVYGDGIGEVMTTAVETRHQKGKAKNKLYAIAKNKNKPHIHKCNLTKKRHLKRERRKKETLKNRIRKGINQLFNSHKTVYAEDLSAPIKSKKRSKAMKRNLSEWCKGEIQKGLEEIAHRRCSVVEVVNSSYTSQVDSRNGTLLGHRNGDQFFTFDGDVLQADSNAALNVLNRAKDEVIHRFMKYQQVQKILIERTASFLATLDMTLADAYLLGWLDSKHKLKKQGVGITPGGLDRRQGESSNNSATCPHSNRKDKQV
jgi:IS605 OrfB family transposase